MNISYFTGKIRLVIHKKDSNYFDNIDDFMEIFEDHFITDIDDPNSNSFGTIIHEEIDNNGIYLFVEDIGEILQNYPDDSYIEIIATASIPFDNIPDEEGNIMLEPLDNCELLDVQSRQLTNEQVKIFIKKE